MAHSLSARKRIRQSERRRQYNRAQKSRVRTAWKKTLAAFASGDKEASTQLARSTQRLLDQMVSRKVINRNKGSRLKSRLAKQAQQAASA